MKKWYITPSSNMMIDFDTESAVRIDAEYLSINDAYMAPCDCKIFFTDSNGTKEYDVKEGQIVITFYKKNLPNQILIVDNPQLKENIQFYKDEIQKEKERWAAEKTCEPCADCEACSSN